MKKVKIYTDGACSGNPGPGGYGIILVHNGKEKELSGGSKRTTNNRMELTAVIVALQSLKEPCQVHITTDSKYVVDAVNKNWLKSWAKKDFSGKANPDLWKKYLEASEKHEVEIEWIKGHAGHEMNERCDKLAVKACNKFK